MNHRSKFEDLTGQKFNRWTVVGPHEIRGKKTYWLCRCECGTERYVRSDGLKSGSNKSCGCYKSEVASSMWSAKLDGKRFGKLLVVGCAGSNNHNSVVWKCLCECGNSVECTSHELLSGTKKSCGCDGRHHGESHTRLYYVWASMRRRCDTPSAHGYERYGGRGIKVCDEWSDYRNFRDWAMSSGYDPDAPTKQCTIDRIDPDGDYCPENCRWATWSEQASNKRPYRIPAKFVPVDRIDNDGNVIESYPSVRDAAEATGCGKGAITRVCEGRTVRGKTHGMRFRYADTDKRVAGAIQTDGPDSLGGDR